MSGNCLPRLFYSRRTEDVAKDLIGMRLVRMPTPYNGVKVRLSGKIVETEAYGASDDEASHARMGPTLRNSVMFGKVGRAYVYFTYGTHYCVNVTARSDRQQAGAVLIRALEPVEGIEAMKDNRGQQDLRSLASGPGKLTKAMRIGPSQNGADMTSPQSEIFIERGHAPARIVSGPRIGITRATEVSWRFLDPAASEYVSRRIRINEP